MGWRSLVDIICELASQCQDATCYIQAAWLQYEGDPHYRSGAGHGEAWGSPTSVVTSHHYNGTWSTASSVCTMQLSLTRLGLLLSSLDTNSLPATDPGQKSLQQFQLIGCSHLAWIPISRPSQYCYCELGRRVFTDTLIKIINVLRYQIFPLINPKDY